MARKKIGYTKLEWICPSCKSRNPGPEKTCLSCGTPQPLNVQFEQASSQQLIKDQTEIEKAKSGADIHCAFCGARNLAGAKVCTQCGADLEKGIRRETGQVIGAFQSEPIKQIACPNCATLNPGNALKCTSCGSSLTKIDYPKTPTTTQPIPARKIPNYLIWGGLGLLVLLIICGVIFSLTGSRTQGVIGTVQDERWITNVAIEALQPASYANWLEDIPGEATIGDCTLKLHHVQDQPVANAVEVCGTPYSVDQGQGYAEVVQDCEYEIYEDYCEYTTMEWQQVDVVTMQGNDYAPTIPQPELTSNQRLGDEQVSFEIVFMTKDGQYTYKTSDFEQYKQFVPGSQWTLNINGFNDLVSIEPINQ